MKLTPKQKEDNMKVWMIDPPSGWKFGFPKRFNPKPNQTTWDWLIQEGYPECYISLAKKRLRYWEAEVTVSTVMEIK